MKQAKNIGEFHQQDKLPSKLLRLQAAKVMHWKWLNFRLLWAYSATVLFALLTTLEKTW